MAEPDKQAFRKALASSKNIIILSGAGASVASGISTFRGSTAGSNVVLSYHTPEAFKETPGAVWFYHERMRQSCLQAKPNDAHKAITALCFPSVLSRIAPAATSPALHVTQNVDSLSSRLLQTLPPGEAPPPDATLLEMHGSIFATRCTSCNHVQRSYSHVLSSALSSLKEGDDDLPVAALPRCGGDAWNGSNRYGRCGCLLRPEVVWFGEIPPLMGEIARKMNWCDLLIIVGTSFSVQPAAGFASQVKKRGGVVAVFNLERSVGDEVADYIFLGKCEETLPDVLDVKRDIELIWSESDA